jgi:hypothetical protein
MKRRAAAASLVTASLVAGLALLGLGNAPALAAAGGADEVTVTVPGWTPTPTPTVDVPDVDENGNITNAQLRWGLNAEAGSGAFFGGCNFLSAGLAGDAGSGKVWAGSDGLYSASAGAVRIEKPDASGQWLPATYETRCLDPQGRVVSTSSTTSSSGNQVVIDGGSGTLKNGELQIQWRGSFTVVFYGGLTYWSVTDPVLTVDASGNGRLVGSASGYGTSMEDQTRWDSIPARPIVLADIRRADTAAAAGFSVVPEYLGVSVSGQAARTPENTSYWGSFPESFVEFHTLTGQRAYWHTSNGVRDPAKPATAMYISYDASAPVAVPAPGVDSSAAAAAASNPLRRPPALAAPVAVPPVPTAPIGNTVALTTVPARQGLVPAAVSAMSPLVVPLLGTAAALGLSIIAVLSLMQALPWQRRVPIP